MLGARADQPGARAPARAHRHHVTRLAPLVLVLLAAQSRAAEPAPAPEPTTVLRAADPGCEQALDTLTDLGLGRHGAVCPTYDGVLVRGDTLRALLHAQDERDEARALLEVEREGRRLDGARAAVDLLECQTTSDAREGARAACEASRLPAVTSDERAWSGWPWVAAAVGVVAGVAGTLAIVEAVR